MDQKTILILAALGVGGYMLYNRNNGSTTTTQPANNYPTAAQYAQTSQPVASAPAGAASWLQNIAAGVHTGVDIFQTIKGAVSSVKSSTTAATTAPTTASIVPDGWGTVPTATS